jgi:glycosyl-4,4'-diaponeurosporenoate acyltransferase
MIVLLLNIFLWPLIQLSVSWIFLKLNGVYFEKDSWILKRRFFESNSFYEKFFLIKRWKNKLPDGASLFQRDFSKKALLSRNKNYLSRFLVETRRGEISHWVMLLFTPFFFLWNPLWADIVMILYGLATNVPCILAQRYNRYTLQRILN